MAEGNSGKDRNELSLWLGVGVAVGAGVGTALSVALGNIAFLTVGVDPGLMFGASIGAACSSGDEAGEGSYEGMNHTGLEDGPS